MAREDHQGEKFLIGYIIPRQYTPPTTLDLHHFLKKKLPISLLPSAFLFLEAFPLTSGGKLHLQALPVPEQPHRLQVTDFLPPQTALEELIAEMWRDRPDWPS